MFLKAILYNSGCLNFYKINTPYKKDVDLSGYKKNKFVN